jgi:hypothetical protein
MIMARKAESRHNAAMRQGSGRVWAVGAMAAAVVAGGVHVLSAQTNEGQSGARIGSVNWTRARTLLSRYRLPVDTSGINEVDIELSPAVNAEDLEALCAARKDSIAAARRKAQGELAELGEWADPVSNKRRAEAERRLGCVDSFVGDFAAALKHFTAARAALAPDLKEYPDVRPIVQRLEEAVGVTSMRQGEMDNCLVNPSADRCLFPLRPGGRHHAGAGAQAAMETFRSILAETPNDLDLRWLLNLAAMVLGKHPEGVPASQVLPLSLFRSQAAMPRFLDVAARAGLGGRDIAGGTITEDFDGDGLLDVAFSSVDMCGPLRLFRNRGDGRFEDRSQAAGLAGQTGGINLTLTDYNNDGRPDIFVMRGGWEVPMRNSLLRQNADRTFTDVTKAAGLSSGQHATHSAVWLDYDGDGWVDVFVGHEFTPSALYRNRGDGTFEDVAARAGVGRSAFTKGVTAGDYDNDGFPDIYVSNFMGENFLYRNNGNGTFTDVAPRLGVDKPLASFSTFFFDYNNDGRLDLFVVGYAYSTSEFLKHYLGQPPAAEPLTLYAGQPDGTFQDVTAKVGLNRLVPAMGINFGDLDNDGLLDIYLGTGAPSFAALLPNIMLKNDGGTRFVDVTEATGTGHLQKGHGVAFADLDNDGDEDVVLNVGGAVPGDNYDDALFLNPGTPSNWIALRLVGTKANRSAIGARITLRLGGSGPGSSIRYREVTSGGSFGASPLMQHIGLGAAKTIDAVEIEWPGSRTRQVLRNVAANRFLEIREGDDTPVVKTPARVAF